MDSEATQGKLHSRFFAAAAHGGEGAGGGDSGGLHSRHALIQHYSLMNVRDKLPVVPFLRGVRAPPSQVPEDRTVHLGLERLSSEGLSLPYGAAPSAWSTDPWDEQPWNPPPGSVDVESDPNAPEKPSAATLAEAARRAWDDSNAQDWLSELNAEALRRIAAARDTQGPGDENETATGQGAGTDQNARIERIRAAQRRATALTGHTQGADAWPRPADVLDYLLR